MDKILIKQIKIRILIIKMNHIIVEIIPMIWFVLNKITIKIVINNFKTIINSKMAKVISIRKMNTIKSNKTIKIKNNNKAKIYLTCKRIIKNQRYFFN